jgi:hypothetical protein
MQHHNIKIYFCNIIMKYLQHFSKTTETHHTFACNMGIKPCILTSEQVTSWLAPLSLGGARPAKLTRQCPSTPSSVLGDMRPTRPPIFGGAPAADVAHPRPRGSSSRAPSPCTVGELYSPLGHVVPSCGEEQLSSAARSLASRAIAPGGGPSSPCTRTSPRTALLSCRMPHICEGQLGVGASPIVIVPTPSRSYSIASCQDAAHWFIILAPPWVRESSAVALGALPQERERERESRGNEKRKWMEEFRNCFYRKFNFFFSPTSHIPTHPYLCRAHTRTLRRLPIARPPFPRAPPRAGSVVCTRDCCPVPMTLFSSPCGAVHSSCRLSLSARR